LSVAAPSQLGIGIMDAFALLRAYAYGHDLRLADQAAARPY
jgi:hydrogenase/urease accessory protein HupE